jgi:hypothetical protein
MSYRCLCGHVIRDTVYPCPETGDLKWQPEWERASEDSSVALKGFFAAIENGTKDEWLMKFFDKSGHSLVLETIGLDGTRTTSEIGKNFYLTSEMATIVTDIISRYDHREGHSVFRCPECDRLYVQKEYCSNEYDCYEKRSDYSR